jgi:hypothetical protein
MIADHAGKRSRNASDAFLDRIEMRQEAIELPLPAPA